MLQSRVLWNNPSTYYEYILLSLANKEVDWLRAKQDKVRRNNQPEDSEDRQSQERQQPATEEAEHIENDITSHEPVAKDR